MIRPTGSRVVVKKPTRQERTDSGIILPDTVEEGQQTAQGEVVAVGPGKVSESGKEVAMSVKKGDKILYGKYSGTEFAFEGTEYLIMRESDILATL